MKTHKFIRKLVVTTVLLMQIGFVATIAKNNYESNNVTTILSFLFVILILLFGHAYLDLHHEEHSYGEFSVAIWVPIGAVLCHILNIRFDLGSVLSAGIVGTLASFIPAINKQSSYLKKLPTAIYCGVFVGMSNTHITPSISFVISAGMLAGLFLILTKNLFIGIGGKLGTMAFLGVTIVYIIDQLSA